MVSNTAVYQLKYFWQKRGRTIGFIFLGYIIGLGSYLYQLISMGFRGSIFTYILVLITIILILLQWFGSRNLKSKFHRFKLVIIIGLSAGLTYYLFGENLHAEFGIIDDYQIVEYIGPDNTMSVSEIVPLLLKTEVGHPGEFPRYRPSYFAVRIIETFFWGESPFLWYFARLIMSILFASCLWYLLQDYIGFIPAGLFVLYIFTYSFWADIFTRLGPAEAYIVLGITLFALGFHFLIQRERRTTKGWVVVSWTLVTLGIVLAIGSKENALVLVLPCIILWLQTFIQKRGRWIGFLNVSLILFYAIFITWAIVIALKRTGVTIYAQSVSFSSRWEVLLAALKTKDSVLMLAGTVVVGGLFCYFHFVKSDKKLRQLSFNALAIIVGCYFLFVTQFFFYNGSWPIGNRYDFPGLLYRPVFYLTLVWLFVRSMQAAGVNRNVYLGLVAGFSVGLALIIAPGRLIQTREATRRNVQYTQAFKSQYDGVVEKLKANPDWALVIESHSVRDYEPIYGWAKYLAAHGVTNQIFLRMHDYSSETAVSDLDKILTEGLEKTAREGRRGISPLHELEEYRNKCFSLQLSGMTPTECSN